MPVTICHNSVRSKTFFEEEPLDRHHITESLKRISNTSKFLYLAQNKITASSKPKHHIAKPGELTISEYFGIDERHMPITVRDALKILSHRESKQETTAFMRHIISNGVAYLLDVPAATGTIVTKVENNVLLKNLPAREMKFKKIDPDTRSNIHKKIEIHDLRLADLSIPELRLKDSTLHRANLSNATLERLNLTGARITESDFSDTLISSGLFEGATLTKCELSGLQLRHCNLDNTRSQHSNFDLAHMIGCQATSSSFNGCNFSQATLKQTNFESTDLTDCNMHESVLENANFKDSKFKKSDLTNVNFDGANFTNAIFEDSDLSAKDPIDYTQSEHLARKAAAARHYSIWTISDRHASLRNKLIIAEETAMTTATSKHPQWQPSLDYWQTRPADGALKINFENMSLA